MTKKIVVKQIAKHFNFTSHTHTHTHTQKKKTKKKTCNGVWYVSYGYAWNCNSTLDIENNIFSTVFIPVAGDDKSKSCNDKVLMTMSHDQTGSVLKLQFKIGGNDKYSMIYKYKRDKKNNAK